MTYQHPLTVGVALITHHAKRHLIHCLPPWLSSPLKPRVVVVNSSSGDGTVEEAERLGAEVLIIPRKEFNHGSTREKARRHLKTDIVVMATPDAYGLDSSLLEKLIAPLLKGQASVSYARQIPHDGAGFFEAFPRYFNYPERGHIRSLENIDEYGIYSIFCSDSCAAYLNGALDEVGGFRSVLTAEDTYAAADLLKCGHKIAYCADAVVKHSHDYSLLQEFRRHFDTGYSRQENAGLIAFAGKDSKRGKRYMKELFATLFKENPTALPYACLHILSKWTGYQLGRWSLNAPLRLKKLMSGQDFYWVSDDFLNKLK